MYVLSTSPGIRDKVLTPFYAHARFGLSTRLLKTVAWPDKLRDNRAKWDVPFHNTTRKDAIPKFRPEWHQPDQTSAGF